MAFGASGLTNKGRNLQAKAQAGAQLKYTKFVMGDGVLGNQSIATLTNVISPKKNVTVTRTFVVPTDQRANVGMYFTNADVTTGFTWREIGLYAIDPDEGEILYWYGYDQNGTGIPAGGGSEILEQTFDTLVYVGTATNVINTVDQSLVFATKTELDQYLADTKAYTDQKVAGATIPDATTTQKGKVQLTADYNSTSTTLVPHAKALRDGIQSANTAAQAYGTETILPQANANAQGYANAAVAPIIGADSSNLVKNSGALFEMNDWKNVGGVAWSVLADTDSRVMKYFQMNNQLYTDTYAVLESTAIKVSPATTYTLQAVFYTSGSSATGLGMPYIEVKNAASGANIASLVPNANSSWHRKSTTVSIPAGVSSITIRLVSGNPSTGTVPGLNRAVTRVKLSAGAADVPYSSEADDLFIYGQIINHKFWGAL